MRWVKHLSLSAGHTTVDLYPGLLGPLLPILIEKNSWSLSAAGFLVMILQGFANFSQPLVGVLNDQRPMKFYLWAGILIAGLPFCLVMNYHSLEIMTAAMIIAGIGVGMYHPVAAVAVGLGADIRHKGLILGIFAAGGSVGFMLAPLTVVFILNYIGEQFMPLIILPAVALTAYFMLDREIVVSEKHDLTLKQWFKVLVSGGRELFVIWLIAVCRQIVFILMNSFLPVLTMSRGVSYMKSSFYLAGTFLIGMAAMMLGGHLSDRLGRKPMIAMTLFMATPLLYLFLLTSGVLSLVFLLLGSALLVSATPVNIVLGQEAAPRHMGTASALIIGGAPAIAALAALPFGIIADNMGIQTAAAIIFILPLIGAAMVFVLKGKPKYP